MSKIKSSILWILCGLNYIAYLLMLVGFGEYTPNIKLNQVLFYCGMWSFLYSTFISGIATVASIVILIVRLIKNRHLSINNWILLVMFTIYIFAFIPLGYMWWVICVYG